MRSTYHNPILYLVTMHNLTTFYSVRYFVIYIQEKEREKIVHSIRSGPFNFIIFKNYNHEKWVIEQCVRETRWISDKKFRFFRVISIFQGNEQERVEETNRLISLINKSRFDRLPFDTREILSDITAPMTVSFFVTLIICVIVSFAHSIALLTEW